MENNKNRKNLIGIILVIIIIGLIMSVYFYTKFNKNNSNNIQFNINALNELNQKVDDYYMQAFNQEMFTSQYSYLIKADGTEATIDDISEFTGYKIPEEFSNAVIHFVKPSSLLDYPNVKIKEQEGNIDLEVLTVYTAIPMEDGGMFISSKYDEGGILTSEEYKEFVLNNSPIYGEIRNPKPTSEEYKLIKDAVGKYNNEVLDGNVKYLACNDKYAMIVISSKENPSIIKQFLLENKNNNWEVTMSGLETNPKVKIFINTSYPNFDLNMLPKYNLSEFTIVSGLEDIVKQLKEQGGIKDDEILTYSCGSGRFSYMEFKSGYKMLGYINDQGTFDIYEVDSYVSALQKMIELDSINPPTFIINFEN